jgi:hypothetical protein
MKHIFLHKLIVTGLLVASTTLVSTAQKLDVSIINTGNNVMRIVGVATAPGFDAPNGEWTTMNLTWRLPKSAAVPPPTVGAPPPAITPEVVNESSAFTGATPQDVFNGGTDLTMFDLTTFGEPDDGYWYFQVTGNTETTQNIPAGSSVTLYEFTVPAAWNCPGCVEILTTEVPALLAHGISTASYIDNATLPPSDMDVLNIVANNAVLPVMFVSFEAEKIGDHAKLTWKTTDEQNVNGYYVEHSTNAISYSLKGYVPALPSATENTYNYIDEYPTTGNNYYRIRQEDIDGRVTYSDTRRLIFNNTGSLIVSVYPIPVADKLKVNIQAGVNEKATLRISDMHGRTVKLRPFQLKAQGNLETIEVGDLQSGMYVIELVGTTVKRTIKFIKD